MLDTIIVLTIMASVLIVHMFIEAHLNRLISIDLNINGLPEPFIGKRIFFISDIHRRRISRRWVESFNPKADYLIIGGDLTEKGVSLSRVRENVQLLKEQGPVYFIWGNHDWDAGHHQVKKLLDRESITILDNTTYIVHEDGASLNFSGVNDLLRGHCDLEKTLAARDTGAPTLLFSHNPDIKYALTQQLTIPYVISGHTHGGQINVFGYTLKEKAGVKKMPYGTLIISGGYGTTKLPLRLGAKPDALMLTLKRKKP
ncbi:metallophosphoesterase [Sporolactobacillus sp. STCC-11]|uniref:metallophosphoesterase n=1 Tax=Sporolactobacillus caesalpiniae TaxID=3230362 RepID=UPI00339A2EA4